MTISADSPKHRRRIHGQSLRDTANDSANTSEDASAGIDVPAADLYQARAREEGTQLGVEYVNLGQIVS